MSISTGSRVQCSIAYFATRPEWYAVPHATTKTLFTSRRTSSEILRSSSARRRISSTRPTSVSRIALGCSWISLSMKVSKPPFSAREASQSTSMDAGCTRVPSKSVNVAPVRSHLDDPSLVHRDHRGRPSEHRRDVGGEDASRRHRPPRRAGTRPSRRRGDRAPPTTSRRASTPLPARGPSRGRPPPAIRPSRRRSSIRCATSSVSVSDARVCPSFSRRARSCWKFSMMPLWITATVPEQSRCGWALRCVGAPCVAHRVWPIATVPGGCPPSSSAVTSSESFPARLTTVRSPSSTATPAESYPRYSRRRSPSRTIGRASSGPT